MYNYLSLAAELLNIPLSLSQLKDAQDFEPGNNIVLLLRGTLKVCIRNGVNVEEGCISGLSNADYFFYKGLGAQQDLQTAYEFYSIVLQEINDDDSDANMCIGLLYSKGLGAE